MTDPVLHQPPQSSQPQPQPHTQPQPPQGDATGGLIPYKNVPALLAYYAAVFSLIPLLGFPLGIAAILLGIVGLRRRNANPHISGAAHAWVGIILGAITSLLWGALVVLIIMSIFMEM